jgi:hypothetical protein
MRLRIYRRQRVISRVIYLYIVHRIGHVKRNVYEISQVRNYFSLEKLLRHESVNLTDQ